MALKDAVVTKGVKWIDGFVTDSRRLAFRWKPYNPDLSAEGWKNLVYLTKDKMYTGDLEGTVDGVHPNDLGMESMAKAFGAAVRQALHLK